MSARTTIGEYATAAMEWYQKHERRVNIGSFILGFSADSFIFTKIDLTISYFILAGYLLVVGGGIFLQNMRDRRVVEGHDISEYVEPWIPFLIQFSFGSLFSGFAIMYSRSATLYENWPFIVIVVGLLLGNEFLRKRYQHVTFQVSVYFFTLLSYSFVIMPYIIHQIGPSTFFLCMAVSVSVLFAYCVLLWVAAPRRFRRSALGVFLSVIGICACMSGLYFTNSIPPVPLSVKEIGVEHRIVHEGDVYHLWYEDRSVMNKLLGVNEVHLVVGDPLYVYSSIFSPSDLDITVAHVWQFYDTTQNKWIDKARIAFTLYGGRAAGYRGYTEKFNIEPGAWRVNVENDQGQLLRRINMMVFATDTEPYLVTGDR